MWWPWHRKYLEAADNLISTSTQVQSFYVLYDAKNGAQADGTTAGINGRASLQTSTVSGTTISTPDFLWAEASNASATQQKAGWYMDYPTPVQPAVNDKLPMPHCLARKSSSPA